MPSSPVTPGSPVPIAQDERELAAFLGAAPEQRRATIAANVLAFGGLLRAAGLPVALGRTLDAARALDRIEIANRADVRAAFAATLIAEVDQRALFDALFDVFWSLEAPPPARLTPPASLDGSRPLEGPAVQQLQRAASGEQILLSLS